MACCMPMHLIQAPPSPVCSPATTAHCCSSGRGVPGSRGCERLGARALHRSLTPPLGPGIASEASAGAFSHGQLCQTRPMHVMDCVRNG
jgi:hypothetical protein